jgi:hypothetical protein
MADSLLTPPALPPLPPATAALVARAQALTWAEARHAAFPAPGAAADYASFLLSHADESLLWLGVADVPLLNDAAAALLADATAALLDAARRRGDDGVGSLHSYGAEMDVFFPRLLGEIAAAVEPLYRLLYREGAVGIDAAPAAGARARGLVTHSSHAIGYGLEGQRELKLKLHVDDSRLTVNLCLGRPGFTGGCARAHAPRRRESSDPLPSPLSHAQAPSSTLRASRSCASRRLPRRSAACPLAPRRARCAPPATRAARCCTSAATRTAP